MKKGKINVFISYAHEDYESAEQIYDYLFSRGCELWLDKTSLLPGQRWENVIEKAISEADFFITLQSFVSVEKTGTFQKEQRIAIEKQRMLPPHKTFIIPVRVDECRISHDEIRKLQWVEMFAIGFDKAMQEIVDKILPGKTFDDKSKLPDRKKRVSRKECVIVAPDSGNQYCIDHKWYEDDVYTWYHGTTLSGDRKGKAITMKVVRDSRDNGLLSEEFSLLKNMRTPLEKDSKQIIFLRKTFLLKPVDRLTFSDNSAEELKGKRAIIFKQLVGAMNFFQLKKNFPYGVPDRHFGWIIERLLLVLGFIHSQDLILGNISPATIWVLDKDEDEVAHNRALFTDFSFALHQDGDSDYRILNDFSEPEIGRTASPHKTSDMYSLGRSLQYIIGGDANCEFQEFIESLCQERREKRPINAWQELERFKEIRQKYYTITQPIFFNQQ